MHAILRHGQYTILLRRDWCRRAVIAPFRRRFELDDFLLREGCSLRSDRGVQGSCRCLTMDPAKRQWRSVRWAAQNRTPLGCLCRRSNRRDGSFENRQFPGAGFCIGAPASGTFCEGEASITATTAASSSVRASSSQARRAPSITTPCRRDGFAPLHQRCSLGPTRMAVPGLCAILPR